MELLGGVKYHQRYLEFSCIPALLYHDMLLCIIYDYAEQHWFHKSHSGLFFTIRTDHLFL